MWLSMRFWRFGDEWFAYVSYRGSVLIMFMDGLNVLRVTHICSIAERFWIGVLGMRRDLQIFVFLFFSGGVDELGGICWVLVSSCA